jgi:AAA domain
LAAGDVMIVDEASMLATRDLDALATATDQAGAKLLLVGDPAQIGAVDAAGGMLPALAHRLGAPAWSRCTGSPPPGNPPPACNSGWGDPAVIDTYSAAGRIHDHPNDAAALAAVLATTRR